jgi:hypothetical protein
MPQRIEEVKTSHTPAREVRRTVVSWRGRGRPCLRQEVIGAAAGPITCRDSALMIVALLLGSGEREGWVVARNAVDRGVVVEAGESGAVAVGAGGGQGRRFLAIS